MVALILKVVLEQMVKSKGLESIVFFVGFQTDIENWLAAFDVFVLPSLTEGTPMALLEAMAMGIPVIASAVGGVSNVLTDEINGLLITPGNIKDICDKIIILKNSRELKYKLLLAGINTIKMKYNINNWCRDIERHYQNLAYYPKNALFKRYTEEGL